MRLQIFVVLVYVVLVRIALPEALHGAHNDAEILRQICRANIELLI